MGRWIVFCNFGAVGANFVGKIGSSVGYEDMISPRVEYLSSSVCAAVSEQGIIYYEGAEIPEEASAVAVNAEILSVFFGEDRVGISTEESQNPEEMEEPAAASENTEVRGNGRAGEDAEETGSAENAESGEDAESGDAEAGTEESGSSGDEAAAEDTAAAEEENTETGKSTENTETGKSTENTENAEKTENTERSRQTEEEEGRYQVNVYDTSGRLTLSLRTDLKYTQAKFSGNMLILYGDTECEIYSGQGVLKYAGAFDTAIADLYKTSGFQRYVVVFSDRTDTIKLK